MSLNHAANWTRPDLAYLVSKCAKFMQAPGEVHVKFLKRGLRYLRGKRTLALSTISRGLLYGMVCMDFLMRATRMIWTREDRRLHTCSSIRGVRFRGKRNSIRSLPLQRTIRSWLPNGTKIGFQARAFGVSRSVLNRVQRPVGKFL